jgi:predicted dehydrogenase
MAALSAATRIGWGILGAGRQAKRFARDLTTVDGARLAAVASRTSARAQAAAKIMGARLGVHGLDGLAILTEVDVIYIATPTHRHKTDCLTALAAGKHVLCEKPLAMTEADAREVAEAADRAGLFCMEALWTHFTPALMQAEQRLADGAIGIPRTLLASFGLPSRRPEDPAAMPDGGALLDRGCYLISLALRLFGDVHAIDGRVIKSADGADLTAAATLAFGGGKTAVLTASLIDQLENRLFIGGDAGSITLNDITCPTLLTITKAAISEGPAVEETGLKARLREAVRRAVRQSPLLTRVRSVLSERPRAAPCRGFGFVHEIEEVQACLRAGRRQSAIHPLSRSIETLRIIEAIGRLDSHRTGG